MVRQLTSDTGSRQLQAEEVIKHVAAETEKLRTEVGQRMQGADGRFEAELRLANERFHEFQQNATTTHETLQAAMQQLGHQMQELMKSSDQVLFPWGGCRCPRCRACPGTVFAFELPQCKVRTTKRSRNLVNKSIQPNSA